jgi:macrolide-specific efflux system membrane fusion protein
MVLLLLSGCSLLPEEEELRTAPVVSAYEAEEYKYVLVTQGDMILKEDMVCFYEPTQEESLSFAVGGEYYGTVYVKAGDTVKRGIAGELDLEDVKPPLRIAGCYQKA